MTTHRPPMNRRAHHREHRTGPSQLRPLPASATLRVAVIDREIDVADALARYSMPLDWEIRLIDRRTSIRALVVMRLNALVLDPAALDQIACAEDPWRWLGELAGALPQLPILICTAPASVSERVHGLALGADDWLTKTTLHPDELIARIQRLTENRRAPLKPAHDEPLAAGELLIRHDHQQVFVNGISAQLTAREFEILALFATTPGIVQPREEIYSRIWGYALVPGDRSIDVFIGKLRGKLARVSPGWDYLHTHFRVGYRFAAQRAPVEAERDRDAHRGTRAA